MKVVSLAVFSFIALFCAFSQKVEAKGCKPKTFVGVQFASAPRYVPQQVVYADRVPVAERVYYPTRQIVTTREYPTRQVVTTREVVYVEPVREVVYVAPRPVITPVFSFSWLFCR